MKALLVALALGVTALNPDARNLIIRAKRSYMDWNTNREAGNYSGSPEPYLDAVDRYLREKRTVLVR